MKTLLRSSLIVFAVVLTIMAGTADAGKIGAVSGFTNITNNGGDDAANQFTVEIWDTNASSLSALGLVAGSSPFGANEISTDMDVIFVFKNSANPQESSITDVYFDDSGITTSNGGNPPSYIASGNILDVTAVPVVQVFNISGNSSFSVGANPSSLPSQNTAVPAFNSDVQFSADSDSPVSGNGINESTDALAVAVSLTGSIDDLIAAIQNGSFRFGMHVQAIYDVGDELNEYSDSFVGGDYNVVPEPASIALMGLGSILAGFGVRRRNKKKATEELIS